MTSGRVERKRRCLAPKLCRTRVLRRSDAQVAGRRVAAAGRLPVEGKPGGPRQLVQRLVVEELEMNGRQVGHCAVDAHCLRQQCVDPRPGRQLLAAANNQRQEGPEGMHPRAVAVNEVRAKEHDRAVPLVPLVLLARPLVAEETIAGEESPQPYLRPS